MTWQIERYHIVPTNDLREHSCDAEKPCWCNPREIEDGHILVHNSMDQRELYETGERKMS
jgi:hypothetical protein